MLHHTNMDGMKNFMYDYSRQGGEFHIQEDATLGCNSFNVKIL